MTGEDWSHEDARPTIASGIAVSMPPRLFEMVEAIKLTAGTGVTVTEELLEDWQKRIASSEGLFVEITSAVAFAGLAELIKSGTIQKGSSVCVPITGSGLKEPLH
jgi:threonine synthase